jgi:GntR family transcriptional regulator, transcriptional repressor for pyruvate dehydrogenase complex
VVQYGFAAGSEESVTAQARDPRGTPGQRAGRAHDAILDWLEAQLVAGTLHAGDRLPAERDLAAMLGVSRAAVREAMRVMGALGTVSQGTGSGSEAGTILLARPAEALTRFLRLHVLLASIGRDDVIHARIALERESARLAATRASPAEIGAMQAHLAEMGRPGITPEEFSDHDTAFHVALAHASGNLLVAELTIALREAMRPMLVQGLEARPNPPAVMAHLVGEHAAILDAVAGGDVAAAAERIEAHIRGFYGAGVPAS